MMHKPGISKARTLGQEVLAKYGSRMLCSYPVSERNWGIYLIKPTAAGVRTRRKACLFTLVARLGTGPSDFAPELATRDFIDVVEFCISGFVSVISLPSPRQRINR